MSCRRKNLQLFKGQAKPPAAPYVPDPIWVSYMYYIVLPYIVLYPYSIIYIYMYIPAETLTHYMGVVCVGSTSNPGFLWVPGKPQLGFVKLLNWVYGDGSKPWYRAVNPK